MQAGGNDLSLFGEIREKERDNTVGKESVYVWEKYPQHCHAFGLWCADGYHRSSSIGISNVDVRLVRKFRAFLCAALPVERLRLRIYHPRHVTPDLTLFSELAERIVLYPMRKCRQSAMQLYVNCRPLLRLMRYSRDRVSEMSDREQILTYFAGRFDGDGSVNLDGKTYCRIMYTTREEAEVDQSLLNKIGYSKTSVYYYRTSNAFVVYISKTIAKEFIQDISRYAVSTPNMHTLLPVETSSTKTLELGE